MESHEAMGGLVSEMAADSSVIVVPRWTSWSLQSADVALPSGDVPSLRTSRRGRAGEGGAFGGLRRYPVVAVAPQNRRGGDGTSEGSFGWRCFSTTVT